MPVSNAMILQRRLYQRRLLLVISALKALWLLGAIDAKQSLTTIGRAMAAFPLEPSYARAMLASQEYSCAAELLDIISVLSASSKLFFDTAEQRDAASEARQRFRHPSGDHLTILNAVKSYREVVDRNSKEVRDWCRKQFLNERTLVEASKIRNQLRTTCARIDINWKASCGDNEDAILKSLAHGLIQNAALLQPDGYYKQIMGPSVSVTIVITCNHALHAASGRENTPKLCFV
jgi:HrpA-like RNA helicase